MAGARSTGTANDDYGHQLVVGDIERLFQILSNEPGSALPTATNGEQLGIITLDVCDNGVARKLDVLGVIYDA